MSRAVSVDQMFLQEGEGKWDLHLRWFLYSVLMKSSASRKLMAHRDEPGRLLPVKTRGACVMACTSSAVAAGGAVFLSLLSVRLL